MTYKLTDNVAKTFDFDIDGIIYKMRYPNGEERKAMAETGQKANTAINKAQKAQDEGNQQEFDTHVAEAEKHAKDFQKVIDALISTEAKDAPSLEDALEKQPSNVIRHFNVMLEQELSVTPPKPRP